jgi:phosphoenolpyruvate carboxylase
VPGSFWSILRMSPQIMPSDTELKSRRAEEASALEEDTRLRNDIRLLGRILGDTVRDQEGADVFDLVERIRQTSIRFHRDDDKPARRELELILDSMSISQTRTTSARCERAPRPAQRRAQARWR